MISQMCVQNVSEITNYIYLYLLGLTTIWCETVDRNANELVVIHTQTRQLIIYSLICL